MTLAEYNLYIKGCDAAVKNQTANSILTGFYCGYYVNGGKKAQKPKELIEKLYEEKQPYSVGAENLEKARRLFG